MNAVVKGFSFWVDVEVEVEVEVVKSERDRQTCLEKDSARQRGAPRLARIAVTRIRTWVLAATTRCPNH